MRRTVSNFFALPEIKPDLSIADMKKLTINKQELGSYPGSSYNMSSVKRVSPCILFTFTTVTPSTKYKPNSKQPK